MTFTEPIAISYTATQSLPTRQRSFSFSRSHQDKTESLPPHPPGANSIRTSSTPSSTLACAKSLGLNPVSILAPLPSALTSPIRHRLLTELRQESTHLLTLSDAEREAYLLTKANPPRLNGNWDMSRERWVRLEGSLKMVREVWIGGRWRGEVEAALLVEIMVERECGELQDEGDKADDEEGFGEEELQVLGEAFPREREGGSGEGTWTGDERFIGEEERSGDEGWSLLGYPVGSRDEIFELGDL